MAAVYVVFSDLVRFDNPFLDHGELYLSTFVSLHKIWDHYSRIQVTIETTCIGLFYFASIFIMLLEDFLFSFYYNSQACFSPSHLTE